MGSIRVRSRVRSDTHGIKKPLPTLKALSHTDEAATPQLHIVWPEISMSCVAVRTVAIDFEIGPTPVMHAPLASPHKSSASGGGATAARERGHRCRATNACLPFGLMLQRGRTRLRRMWHAPEERYRGVDRTISYVIVGAQDEGGRMVVHVIVGVIRRVGHRGLRARHYGFMEAQ
ncbi:hypothetical protein GW17_00010390 [Ensete ventricosum]|nr:hypothetical protein GW17_00010390 [Ensete ventricosum]